jgi:hypothetical protein
VAHDVTHDQGGTAAGQGDHVIPVPADTDQVAGRQITRGDVHAEGLRQLGGQQAALQRQRGTALPRVEPGVVDADGGPRREILGHRDVRFIERLASRSPDEHRAAEHPPPGLQRHGEE